MMQKSKIIEFVILVLIIACFVYLYINKPANITDNEKCVNTTVNESELHTISNIKKYDGEINSFRIFIKGSYIEQLTLDFVKEENIQIYEFDAVVNDSWMIHKDHYVGIKLKDILDKKEYKYDNIVFRTEGLMQVTYMAEQITDKTYLVFTRNGKSIGEGRVALLSVDYNYKYSVENLSRMDINYESSSK